MKSVAEMLGLVLNVDQECLDFKGIEEQELLVLFNKYAFHGRNPNDHKDLQKIGKDIVKKLWGSPLAAKVIGRLLNSNMDLNYWRRILKCDSLINLEDAKEVADILKLSYLYLPTDVQQCFRFCAIFPQDYVFEKDALIKLWMASGFLGKQSCLEERPEDIGEKYFNHLLMKSFFESHHFNGKHYYLMHDLMHELAQNVSQGECYRVESNNVFVNIPSSTQHVFLDDTYNIQTVFHLENLRTLIITRRRFAVGSTILLNDSFMKTLRVLKIEGLNMPIDTLRKVNDLIHLRYLTIRLEFPKFHPLSFNKLHHLLVLEVDGSIYFKTTEISNLISVRYMKLTSKIMENFKGAGRLTSLQELNFFVGKDKGQHIDELKTLNNLRELSIEKIENVVDPNEAKNAELSKKENLISLSLIWRGWSNRDNLEHIIDNLQPSPTLKSLTIYDYPGHRSPNWMKHVPCVDLSSLTLTYCGMWEDLPSLAQMPNLRELSMNGMDKVKELDYSCDITRDNHCPFPSLEKLRCENMPNWKSWAGPLSNYGFPNLRELSICDCPNLVELPALPLSLFHFNVENAGLKSLPEMYNSSSVIIPAPSSLKSSLKEMVIWGCPNLKSLDGFLQQEDLDLQAVEKLTIRSCKNLEQIPTGAFGKFESLKVLSIYKNPKLLPVDNQRNLLPSNLQDLELGNYGEFDVQLLESAARLSTLHHLTTSNSPSLSCFPSSENVIPSLRVWKSLDCKRICYSIVEHARGASPGNNMGASLSINRLDISDLSLLFIEPLRSLRFVSEFTVKNCSGMETLPEQWLLQNSSTLEHLKIEDASSLRSLPGTMVRLTALRSLDIRKATLLEEVPELPTDLREKRIEGAGGRRLV